MTRFQPPSWISCSAFCLWGRKSQMMLFAKRQKSWSLDPTTTSTLVPSGKSALAFAECGHVCTPGLLESHRARVRSLGIAPRRR